ncbi:MAG: ABC transporter substrate-binding protein [Candidatus Metalachnospira sp.]|nr:ABC transporter substrate-binding protein [Candidatus Metalachnospira sp.]
MKKLLAIALSALILMTGCSGGKSSAAEDPIKKYGSDKLKLFIWGEYLGEDVISNFEKQYGVDVIVEYFDSNEMMYTKLQAGDAYDVIVPSDYMIQRLISEDMIQKIDKSLVPNTETLAEGVKNLEFDPDNTYSVPYFWGSVGIVYNKKNVPEELVKEKGFEILKDTDYSGDIYMYDSERDSFMVALKALGYSVNTEDDAEIEKAYQWLIELNNTMNPAYVTDEVIDSMINGTKDIAVVYSGDATVILDENKDMGFYMPEEGTNIWCDSMCIPSNAENPLLAHEFMNYMLSYDAAYDNTMTVGYASPNKDVLEEVSKNEYADNEAYLPRANYDKDEVFRDNEVLRQKLSQLWLKVKAQ